MQIKCTCPAKMLIQLKDISFVKNKPEAKTLRAGDELDLAETDVVVLSRYHGDIFKMEQQGFLKVLTEPTRTLFTPGT